MPAVMALSWKLEGKDRKDADSLMLHAVPHLLHHLPGCVFPCGDACQRSPEQVLCKPSLQLSSFPIKALLCMVLPASSRCEFSTQVLHYLCRSKQGSLLPD